MLALLAPAGAAAETTHIIVKREPGLSRAEQQDIRSDAGATLVERMAVPRMELVEVPTGQADRALARLNRDPDVALAEIDSTVHAFGGPDQYMGELWGLNNVGAPNQKAYEIAADGSLVPYPAVADADMNVPAAWSLTQGGGSLVAVVDGGVKAHPDLAGRVAPGYDWVDEDANADDPHGHGTHVAGTIAADVNNGIGIAGVAPKARVVPLRVLNANGSGVTSDIVQAFHFAGQQHVRIVNASFGADTASQLERGEMAKWPNTLFVTAAGNSGGDNDVPSEAKYPCAFDLANVICVGATDAADKRPSWSNYGRKSVDVFAPGVGILSTWMTGYAYSSGTSMAAPHVAGLAALLLARDPNLSTAQLKAAIINTADDKPGLTSVSNGRADAAAAIAAVPADRDGDQVVDDHDNCPDVPNTDQADSDPTTPEGDACAVGVAPPDSDRDTVLDSADKCPYQAGPAATYGCPGLATDANHDGVLDIFDTDGDHLTNHHDNCPGVANPSQADLDKDKVGDACDPDIDGDARANGSDNCPTTPNANQADRDGDHKGDACDSDRDGDGHPNSSDSCPDVKAFTASGCPPQDPDHDGRYDGADACPTEPAATLNGCPLAYVTALTAKVRKRRATITVRTSRGATVQVTVQRVRGSRWVRAKRRLVATSANRATIRLTKLRRGTYRAVVVASSGAGRAKAVTRRFRVR